MVAAAAAAGDSICSETMKRHLSWGIIWLFCLGLGAVESWYFSRWLLPLFLVFVCWQRAEEKEKIFWLAWGAGLWRDLLAGNLLGRSSLGFLLLVAFFCSWAQKVKQKKASFLQ